jgi:uncharacterized protein YuzE
MKPLRVEYDPAVDALAIDFPGFGPGASVRMVRLDRDRVLDYDAEGRLVAIELLNVSQGVNLDGLPAADVVRRSLELVGVRRDAAQPRAVLQARWALGLPSHRRRQRDPPARSEVRRLSLSCPRLGSATLFADLRSGPKPRTRRKNSAPF